MTGHVSLGAGAEFDLVRSLVARWGGVAAGIGDDAAVLAVPRGDLLVASVDAAVEGRHFRRGWLTPREIGYRACAAALSDLAAMAARPLAILVALALPPDWLVDVVDLADGIAEAAAWGAAPIVGGNTSAADKLSITTTVLGSVHEALRRDALRPGDTIYVTGRLGGAGAALRSYLRGAAPAAAHRARFAHPEPRLRESRWLATHGATAAIDVSDGFAADAGHLAAASAVCLELTLDHVPLVAGVTALEAAASGEEYELLVGSPAPLDTADFERTFGVPLTAIGTARAREDAGDAVSLTLHGARVATPRGHDHLSP